MNWALHNNKELPNGVSILINGRHIEGRQVCIRHVEGRHHTAAPILAAQMVRFQSQNRTEPA
jgi:hypothetical protein